MKPKEKQDTPKNRVPEKDRLEDVVGYDRNFDPIAEAYDLQIAESLKAKKQKL